jgi:hypothetical protein
VGGGLGTEIPPGVNSGLPFHDFFYHIFSLWGHIILPRKLGRASVLRLKPTIMPQRVPRSPMIIWGWLNSFLIQCDSVGICTDQ